LFRLLLDLTACVAVVRASGEQATGVKANYA